MRVRRVVVHGEAEVVTLAVDTVRAEMPAKMMDSFMIDCGRRRCVISCAGRLVLIEAKIGRCG